MANTFITADKVARDASILLRENLVAGNLVNRNTVEQMLDGNSGGTVRVSYVPVATATQQDHSSAPTTLSDADITEQYVTVDARQYFYVRKLLNTKEKTYDLDNFTQKVTMPAMVGIAEAIDQFLIDRLLYGFGQTISGTEGTSPVNVADIVNARKVLFDAKCPMDNINAIIGSATEAALLQVSEFASRDYGTNLDSAIQKARLMERYGITWYTSHNAGQAHVNGDEESGTNVQVVGSHAIDSTTLAMDTFTASTGTVNAGTRFTVAGSSTIYTIVKDMTLSSNAGTATIEPRLDAAISDNAVVTFKSEHNKDLLFNPAGTAAAIIAPSPLMQNSAVGSFEGLSIRTTFESSTTSSTGAVDYVLFDVYAGCRVVRPECGLLFQG